VQQNRKFLSAVVQQSAEVGAWNIFKADVIRKEEEA
jgi:hypothetical protein